VYLLLPMHIREAAPAGLPFNFAASTALARETGDLSPVYRGSGSHEEVPPC